MKKIVKIFIIVSFIFISIIQVNSTKVQGYVNQTFYVASDLVTYRVLSEEGATGTVEVVKFEQAYVPIQKYVLNLPETVDYNGVTYTVVSIADKAFAPSWNGYYQSRMIGEVVIPDTVTHIGEYAFNGNEITSVVLPNNGLTIGNYAFQSNNLTEITFPENIGSIGHGAFGLNQGLTSITFSEGFAQNAKNNMFDYSAVETLVIPSYMKEIPAGLMARSAYLKNLTIEEGVTHINNSAFNGMFGGSITEVVLPESLEYIGDSAFACHPIESIRIPKNVQHIGKYPFRYSEIKSIFLDDENAIDLFLDPASPDVLTQTTDTVTDIYAAKIVANYTTDTLLTNDIDENDTVEFKLTDLDTVYKAIKQYNGETSEYVDADPDAATLPCDFSVPLVIEWYKDDVLIDGETGTSLTQTMDEAGDYIYYAKVNGIKLDDIDVTVTAAPEITIFINPNKTEVIQGASASFTATLENDTANAGVTWSVEGVKSKDTAITPLAKSTSQATLVVGKDEAVNSVITIKATSISDPTKVAVATITVKEKKDHSIKPTDPTNPVDPIDPVNPVNPSKPGTPSVPSVKPSVVPNTEVTDVSNGVNTFDTTSTIPYGLLVTLSIGLIVLIGRNRILEK